MSFLCVQPVGFSNEAVDVLPVWVEVQVFPVSSKEKVKYSNESHARGFLCRNSV
jgi:hypothetical protein